MKKFAGEFKQFITKGNFLDLALAIIMGTAFNKIVNSLVVDVITPIFGIILGNVNIAELKWVIRPAEYNVAGDITTAELALTYGVFIQSIIDFLTIAFFLFIAIKILTASKRRLNELGSEMENVWSKISKKEKKQVKKQAKLENKTSGEVLKESVAKDNITISDKTKEAVEQGIKKDELNAKEAVLMAEKVDANDINTSLLIEIRDLLKEQLETGKKTKK